MSTTVYKYIEWGDERIKIAAGFKWLTFDITGAAVFTEEPSYSEEHGWFCMRGRSKHLGDKVVFPEDDPWEKQLYDIS